MTLIQKISTLKLSASFAVLMAATTPNAIASSEITIVDVVSDKGASSSVSSVKEVPLVSLESYADLEKAFPRQFGGIFRMNQPNIMSDRDLCNLKALLGYNPSIVEKLVVLEEALGESGNPVFDKVMADIEKARADKEQQTVLHYIFFLGRSALLASNKTEQEAQFFKIAGFSSPYKLIDLVDPKNSFWSTLQHLGDDNDTRGDFTYVTHRRYSDPTDQVEKLLKKNPFKSSPFFMLMTKPGEDVFGFFALALSYFKGKHPVPVTLSSDEGELHGIPMSPWGKFCHDLAHSEADPADYSVEQFTHNILSLYTDQLREKFKGFSKEKRAQFAVKSMIPVVTQFAIEVHSAYRQSLVDILERSLDYFKVSSKSEKLPPVFEAFAVSAFLEAHEESSDMSKRYVSSDLAELLKSKRSKEVLEIIPQKEEDVGSSSSGKSEEIVAVDRDQEFFSTSFVTGETLLSDEEIFEIVKKLPINSFQLHFYHFGGDNPLNEDEIADYTVSRNKFYIEVSIDMHDGQNYLFRQGTNYARTLNFNHDRQILRPAAALLKEEYDYDIPSIPNSLDEDYEAKVKECDKALRQGMKYLHDFYARTATEISVQENDDSRSIADHFALSYTKALRKLTKSMPAFITEGEGGLQGFLIKATSENPMSK